ncbi:MAG: MFS transporter [Mycobacterium kyogaense]|uniref:MFS transporter n=1 Tax=Mycobacterium kyogaense TaxID=2212479 RepID=UPI002FF76397
MAQVGGRRVLRVARTWMLVGLLLSYFGTTIVGGATPVLVSLSLLPLIWLPVMATLENLQDMCSAPVAKVLKRYDAGHILVFCELLDLILTVLAVLLIAVLGGASIIVVLCCYTVATSFLPLFIDLAEEFYGAEIEALDPGSAARFNTILYAAMPAVSQFASGPLGSLLAGVSVLAVLFINAVASACAIAARYRSVSLGRRFTRMQSREAIVGDSETELPEEVEERSSSAPLRLRDLIQLRGAGSPIFSAAVPLATGLSGVYFAQWCASLVQNKGAFFAAAAVCVGVGALAGPVLARRLRSWVSAPTVLYVGSAATGALMVVAATAASSTVIGTNPTAIFVGFLSYATVASFLMTGVNVTQVTARQENYRGDLFVQVMSWGHSFAAAGGLAGIWAGLVLGANRTPSPALILGALILVLTIIVLRPRSATC